MCVEALMRMFQSLTITSCKKGEDSPEKIKRNN